MNKLAGTWKGSCRIYDNCAKDAEIKQVPLNSEGGEHSVRVIQTAHQTDFNQMVNMCL